MASRCKKGTKEGLRLYYKYHFLCKKNYGTYYLLKCDIKQYFYSIDHEILKKKLRRKIKDQDALYIVDNIIDSVSKGLPIGYDQSNFGNLLFK